MYTLRVDNLVLEIPGIEIARAPTAADNAWQSGHVTLRLIRDVQAMRVFRPGDSNMQGRWFAIDAIMTRTEFIQRHALPSGFTHQALATLPIDATINVGVCSPIFKHPGGAGQIELVSPSPGALRYRPIAGFWSDVAGHA